MVGDDPRAVGRLRDPGEVAAGFEAELGHAFAAAVEDFPTGAAGPADGAVIRGEVERLRFSASGRVELQRFVVGVEREIECRPELAAPADQIRGATFRFAREASGLPGPN